MEDLFGPLYEWFKKFSPYIIVGTIGAVVYRLRTSMTIRHFLASIIISILVSLSVGVVCHEYTSFPDGVIYVLCGISGTFSKLILDEIEEIIGDMSSYFKEFLKIRSERRNERD